MRMILFPLSCFHKSFDCESDCLKIKWNLSSVSVRVSDSRFGFFPPWSRFSLPLCNNSIDEFESTGCLTFHSRWFDLDLEKLIQAKWGCSRRWTPSLKDPKMAFQMFAFCIYISISLSSFRSLEKLKRARKKQIVYVRTRQVCKRERERITFESILDDEENHDSRG